MAVDPLAVTDKQAPYHTNIRATYTGKLLIITGLRKDDFPSRRASRTKHKHRFALPSPPLDGSLDKSSSWPNRQRGANGGANGTADGSPTSSHAGSITAHDDDEPDSGEQIDDDQDADVVIRLPRSNKQSTRQGRRRGAEDAAIPTPPTRLPSPVIPLISEELDILTEADLLPAYLSRTPSPDLDEPDDVAAQVYRGSYAPLTKAAEIVAALAKINPAERRTEKLYALAANTAAILRAWQDEYLLIDRLTAPHAAIPRKLATGDRQPIDPVLFEDQKEADIYDYAFDPKKIGYQDAIGQKIVRDASGREMRQRVPKTRVTADSQVVNGAGGFSEDDGGRNSRARRPANRFDVTSGENGSRKRGIDQVADSIEGETVAKRGRGGRGRGRGRGRGGRGGLLGKRIREMREASAVTAASASADEDTASEAGTLEAPSREGSELPEMNGQMATLDETLEPTTNETKPKGRPKGSKNNRARSDKGVPKGPRSIASQTPVAVPVPTEVISLPQEMVPVQAKIDDIEDPAKASAKLVQPNGKPPKSEKRSESMTAWWAKRKAAAAEAKRKEAEASGELVARPVGAKASARPRTGTFDGGNNTSGAAPGHNEETAAGHYTHHPGQHLPSLQPAPRHDFPLPHPPHQPQPGHQAPPNYPPQPYQPYHPYGAPPSVQTRPLPPGYPPYPDQHPGANAQTAPPPHGHPHEQHWNMPAPPPPLPQHGPVGMMGVLGGYQPHPMHQPPPFQPYVRDRGDPFDVRRSSVAAPPADAPSSASKDPNRRSRDFDHLNDRTHRPRTESFSRLPQGPISDHSPAQYPPYQPQGADMRYRTDYPGPPPAPPASSSQPPQYAYPQQAWRHPSADVPPPAAAAAAASPSQKARTVQASQQQRGGYHSSNYAGPRATPQQQQGQPYLYGAGRPPPDVQQQQQQQTPQAPMHDYGAHADPRYPPGQAPR